MNATLKSTADRMAAARNRKVLFVDPTEKFSGHDVCAVLNPAFKGIVLNLTPGDDAKFRIGGLGLTSWESFHPDKSGTTLYASAFTTALRSIGN